MGGYLLSETYGMTAGFAEYMGISNQKANLILRKTFPGLTVP